jgi:uncharacterized membrane protein YcaP (DUF421 family)
MLTSFFRTVILLFFVILSLRLMGKRQIGEPDRRHPHAG